MKKSSSKLPKSIVKVKPKIGLVNLTHHLMMEDVPNIVALEIWDIWWGWVEDEDEHGVSRT